MYDSHSKGISYTAGFFMLIVFSVTGLILASAINGSIWTNMTGKPLQDFIDGNLTPADSTVTRIMHTINQVLGQFIPAVVTAFALNRKPFRLLGYTPGFEMRQAILVFLAMVFAIMVSGGLSWLTHHIPIPAEWRLEFDKVESDYLEKADSVINIGTPKDFIIALLMMAVLPAICEETLFRGGLQNFLTRGTKNPIFSIIVVSVIFSAVHFSYFGFLSRLFLGLVLGFLFHYSGRLWPSILAHFLNNAIALTVLYVKFREGKPVKQIMTETEAGWWGILMLPAVIWLLIYFKRASIMNRPNKNSD